MRKNKEGGLPASCLSGRRWQAGQILLIVILVMVVALTVGLSVVSRSITTLRITREEATSQKALSGAEAGIEQSLKSGVSIPVGTSFTGEPKTTYGTTINPVSGTEVLVNGGNIVAKDEGADIWLVDHNADGTPNLSSPWTGSLTIYWGDSSGDCNNAALEIAVVSAPIASPVLKRYTFDPCPSRASNNNFSSPSPGGVVSGKSFAFSAALPIITSGLVARVVPLYASSSIGVVGSIALPSQGIVIDSTGVSQGTSRKINVFKGYSQLPIQYFSYGLFSP